VTVLDRAPGLMADQALVRACEALRAGQHADGWWKGELETNVTMDAEDLLLRQFLGVRADPETSATAAWIRSQQRADGTWSTFHDGPGDLSTTVEAWLALRVSGDAADAAHMRRAAQFVLDSGGVESTRVFTRIWLALFGLWPWEAVPVLPPELVLLPPWVPLNIYDFGCWARQTIVPLTVVSAYRPERTLPSGIDVDELRVGAQPRRSAPSRSWERTFEWADKVLHRYQAHPARALRRLALTRAEQWIVHRQEADGGWGGIQPPWVYSLIALHLRGYGNDHPVMAAGLAGLEGFIVRDERGRRLEACQSPVWDTALAVSALADAGAAPDDPALLAAGSWLIDQQILVRGDWSIRRPNLPPGGWAFEFANNTYPDIDDTAEVALALARVDVAAEAAIARAERWVVGMQCRDGGWGAFDVDNTRELCRRLPFCDFGELIDPPSADVTAHTVEFLCAVRADRGPIDRGVAWLLGAQETDGSWFGRWGANHVYGTGAAVPALVASGIPPSAPPIRRAVAWLHRHQNGDGGWGEDLRSYNDDRWRARGASTASQTAWALLALLAADRPAPDPGNILGPAAIERGVAWLVANQRADGTWDEPWFTGTGFPGDFYINYHLYRLVFPVMALGRYLRRDVPDA
jgi:squalene-hopene/tetraprenyl-beta-curcumene cyclase